MRLWLPTLALFVVAAGLVLFARRQQPSPLGAGVPGAVASLEGAATNTLRQSRPPTTPVVARVATGEVEPHPSELAGSAATRPLVPVKPEVVAALNAANAGLSPVPSNMAPATVLEFMRTTIRQYSGMFYGNPVGTNPEITRALNGENPKQVKFITPESGLRINGRGELVDAWGTPFFFHQLSGTEMEIRSAGPDREMWTADDLVIK